MGQVTSDSVVSDPAVSVRIYLPAEDLRGYVTFYYFVEAFRPLTDFLYPEWGNVRLAISGDWSVLNDPRDHGAMPGTTLFGPTDRRGVITTGGGKTVGFGLTPLGWDRLICQDADAMANRVWSAPLEVIHPLCWSEGCCQANAKSSPIWSVGPCGGRR